MIAVIADDFTGAAEMGGIGIRYGHRVILATSMGESYDCDILIFATNMRAYGEQAAMETLKNIIIKLRTVQPSMIFLKMDSVFRGYMKNTLITALRLLKKRRIILIPANPSLHRIIENGVYYYHQKPLMDSGFFPKSEMPPASSNVLDLIGKADGDLISVSSVGEKLPGGIVIGNATREQEIESWANMLGEDIPAGGSSFFTAIVKANLSKKEWPNRSFSLGEKRLYICGSAHGYSKRAIQTAIQHGAVVHYMPKKIFCPENGKTLEKDWSTEIVLAMERHNCVVAAIDDLDCHERVKLSNQIEKAFGELAATVIQKIKLDELLIEGGATAYAVIDRLGFTTFSPKQEFATGVIRMEIEQKKNLSITVKPGSYSWPEQLWNFKQHKNKYYGNERSSLD